MTPLEAMYPNRCYDCLAVCPPDKVLCGQCEAVYAAERQRVKTSGGDDVVGKEN